MSNHPRHTKRGWNDIKQAEHSKTPASSKKTIIIELRLPNWLSSLRPKLPRLKIFKLPKKALIIGTISVLLLAIGGSYFLITSRTSNQSSSDQSPITLSSMTAKTPDYQTLLPANKSISQLGGWTRVSPPNRNPVFAYVDKIGTNSINVSQQPLPNDFKSDTAVQVNLLAEGYKANEKITVGDTIVHIGRSAKGPQSVIFTKNGLLILIKSSVPISNDKWAAYIKALQ